MEKVRVTEEHEKLLRLLALWYVNPPNGAHIFTRNEINAVLNTEDVATGRLLQFAAEVGAITVKQSLHGSPFSFEIRRRLEDILAELDEAKLAAANPAPVDKVEKAQTWVRKNPWLAYPVIFFLAATAVLTFVNQLLDLLTKAGVIDQPK